MELNYNIDITKDTFKKNVNRLVNQIYKLLPNREEGGDWIKPLETIIEELSGMSSLIQDHQNLFFSLLCKLEGLKSLRSENSFDIFRRTIFECLNIMSKIRDSICQDMTT